MFSKSVTIQQYDPELATAISAENQCQQDHVELTASENYVSCVVMEAQGSQLASKYAEDYSGKRYYGGCEYVDIAEQPAIDRVKKLFGAEYASVQPHSGPQVNQAVYTSVLQPGDTILGMSLAHGGYLAHGASVNISGKLYNAVTYGLDENEVLDYAEVKCLALEHKPKTIVAGTSAYALIIDWVRLHEIADKVGVYLLVDMVHYAGLVAVGEYPNPIPLADFVTITTRKTLRGPRGGVILYRDITHEKALNSAIFPNLQGGPLMHVIVAKAIAFKEALQPEFKEYAKQAKINVATMAEELIKRGLRIVSGHTESHVFLVDLQPMKITGKTAEAVLGRVYITVNKNAIPSDPEKPSVTSGTHIGSAAMTTRGFTEADARELANLIADVLANPDDETNLAKARAAITALCDRHPVYGA